MVRIASPLFLAVPACLLLFSAARTQTLVTEPYRTFGSVPSPYWNNLAPRST
jgi:hypothetical protein